MVSNNWVANHLQVGCNPLSEPFTKFLGNPNVCHLGEAGTWCLLVFLGDLQNVHMHILIYKLYRTMYILKIYIWIFQTCFAGEKAHIFIHVEDPGIHTYI